MSSSSDLRRLAFRVGGSGDRAVIFVHGMYQSSIFWQPTLNELPAGVRGFAVDLPGFGGSSGLPGPYTIQGHAEAIDGFAREHGIAAAVLVGNSMGGIVCQQVGINGPSWLTRLVLVSTGPNVPDPAAALAAADAEEAAPWDREAAAGYVHHFFVRQPADPAPYVEAALQASRAAALETRRSSALTDLRPELGKIKVPTVIIQGALDAGRTPAVGAEMAGLIPDATLHVVAGVGHTPMLEDAGTFRELLHASLTV